MTRTTNRITRSLAPALVMAALFVPTAGAYQDISSLDMHEGAEASGRHDLRSQDALDAARSLPPDQLAAVAAGLRPAHHDLRLQDALDAARSLPPDQLAAVAEGLRSGRSVELAPSHEGRPRLGVQRRPSSSAPHHGLRRIFSIALPRASSSTSLSR